MKKTIIYFFLLFIISFMGCKETILVTDSEEKIKSIEQLNISSSFSYETVTEKTINIKTGINERTIPVTIYLGHPENNGKKIATYAVKNGEITAKLSIPAGYDTLYGVTNYIGLQNVVQIYSLSDFINVDYTDLKTIIPNSNESKVLNKTNLKYKTLGGWNNLGVPDYLVKPGDYIDQFLLDKLNTSLPEKSHINNHHPEYLNSNSQTNLILTDSSEVYITFVHEGAGYKNVFGFYTYPLGTIPQSISDIEKTMTIVFPNTSYNGSGGGLYSGDKVKIGNFSKNTVVGWFLLSDGYTQQGISDGKWRLFSDKHLNPEKNSELKQHVVALNDVGNDRIILGFEDINREVHGCDNDFNDALFYVTANPFTSINTNDIQLLDIPVNMDFDGDGVANDLDEFPYDPTKAFTNHFPAEGVNGTLAFEDLWPSRGDYDFNDLVVQYHYTIITSGDNKAIEIDALFIIKAIGAGFKNGFGISLELDQSNIQSVTGSRLFNNLVSTRANGTEAGNPNAVIIVFDDAHRAMKAGGNYVNTTLDGIYQQPVSIEMKIVFNNPVFMNELGKMPLNPFIFIDKDRSREVHLPGSKPTSLADNNFFLTYDDDSNLSINRFYMTKNNLPWALHIPEEFEYPLEKISVLSAYPNFGNWAESNGLNNPHWYKNLPGNKVLYNIFRK